MTAILGVHGVGNDRPLQSDDAAAHSLATIWTAALTKGLPPTEAVDLHVAYYAPQLRSDVPQGAEDPDALDPPVQAMIRAWIGLLDPPAEIAAGRATAPLRHALEWVAERFGLDTTLTRIFTTVFFREVATYFDPSNSYRRTRSRNVFLKAITAHRPRIVIAHSLGSVVAYEALWAQPDLTVDLLLTLGSPLGMPDVVFPRLDPSTAPTGRGQRPPGVRTWINISDAGDPIAIPRHLAQRFRDIEHDLSASQTRSLQTPEIRTSRIWTVAPSTLAAKPSPDPHRRHVADTKPIPLQAIPSTRSRERALSCAAVGQNFAAELLIESDHVALGLGQPECWVRWIERCPG